MKKYKCLIVDDEPIAIEIIESYIKDLEKFNVTATCGNAIAAFDILKDNNIDLLFLDIEMPRVNGLQLLSVLHYKPEVIITTAYRNYAVESYEYEVLDYLLKPISFERFLKAIDKFHRKKSTEPQANEETIKIKVNKQYLLLKIPELLYIEGASDYVKVHTQLKTHITYDRLSNFENILKPKGFVRIHKSYLVALKKIERYSWNSVVLAGVQLPVGRRFKDELMAQLKKNKSENDALYT